MIAPTTNRVTQGKHGQYNAVDYSASPDVYIYAPEDGKITSYGVSGDCGKRLALTAGDRRHGFCHLEEAYVKVGDSVKKGQRIGKMGYTGKTIPEGPAGRHLHWVIYIISTGVYVYPPDLVNEQGGSMAVDDIGLARIKAFHIAGRNGFDGRPNALAGEADDDLKKNHVGKESNSETWNWYNSAEGKQFREKIQPQVYAQRDSYKKSLAEVTKDRDGLIIKYDAHVKQIAELSDTNSELQANVIAKDAEIVDLKKQLENCNNNGSEDEVVKNWFMRLIDKIIFWNKGE